MESEKEEVRGERKCGARKSEGKSVRRKRSLSYLPFPQIFSPPTFSRHTLSSHFHLLTFSPHTFLSSLSPSFFSHIFSPYCLSSLLFSLSSYFLSSGFHFYYVLAPHFSHLTLLSFSLSSGSLLNFEMHVKEH